MNLHLCIYRISIRWLPLNSFGVRNDAVVGGRWLHLRWLYRLHRLPFTGAVLIRRLSRRARQQHGWGSGWELVEEHRHELLVIQPRELLGADFLFRFCSVEECDWVAGGPAMGPAVEGGELEELVGPVRVGWGRQSLVVEEGSWGVTAYGGGHVGEGQRWLLLRHVERDRERDEEEGELLERREWRKKET